MTEKQAFEWLEGLSGFKLERYGLKGAESLLNLLGRPDRNLKIIHITGTNGKGTVSEFCKQALIEAGNKVGSFISPHIINFNERIQINGNFIETKELVELINLVKPVVEKLAAGQVFCSQFDVITAIALEYFKRNLCNFVVLEVGMGGRLDSTNAVLASSVVLTIITKIGLDHIKELGPGLKEIAFEKAGIIKPGVACVCGKDISPEALEIIEKTCTAKNAKLIRAFEPEDVVCRFDFNSFKFQGHVFKLRLCGPFQVENAMIALTALLQLNEPGFDSNSKFVHLKNAFEKAFWPARFELFKGTPAIILDGAHNVDGAVALKKALDLCNLEPKIGVFSILQTKDYAAVLAEVKKMGLLKLVLTQMDFANVVEVSKLEAVAHNLNLNYVSEKNWRKSLSLAKELAGEGGVVVVFGSLYFASQVRRVLKERAD